MNDSANDHGRDGTGASASSGRPRTRRRLLRIVSAGLPVMLAACAEGAKDATPPKTAVPAATSVPPTPSPAPTPTPIPRSPLSGKTVAEGATIRRRIVAVKIDNAPVARPQFGLSVADTVYEQLAEGGLTRFLALFLERDPERVGPVRSARLTDIYLAQEWEFLLAYAGAGRTTSRLLAEAIIPLFKAPELGEKLDGTGYFRDASRPIPNNMFVKISEVREQAAKDPGLSKEVEIRAFPFHDPPAEVGPIRSINLPYIPAAAVTWQYVPETSAWKRVMAGTQHVDALTNQQIQAENVVVQYAQIFTAQNVEPDAAGNPVLDTVLRGQGKARLFHSGQMWEGTWWKEHDRSKTEWYLPDGHFLPFRPGKVWVHIVPTDFQATWT